VHSLGGKLIFSATDLSNFLACSHLTTLTRRTATGGPAPPRYPDPGREVLQQRGLEHERNFLARCLEKGPANVADLTRHRDEPLGPGRYTRHAEATGDAMRDGADVVYQGCLFDGTWLGFPDFLQRVDRPSTFGAWSYEVVDTKLAREAKAGALLQVLLYADLLERAQGVAPDLVHLALGGPDKPFETFRVKDYAAYFRSIRQRFLDFVTPQPTELRMACGPVPHCQLCDWDEICTRERREVDHLSFVAGITRQQRRALDERGISTLEALGDLDLGETPRLDGVSRTALARIHMQARIQLRGRRENAHLHELLRPIVANEGLGALPPPSEGDLFFDLEGDPYAFESGIEYLFGVADGHGEYTARWSLDPTAERATFEWFIDLVLDELEHDPGLHVYHYAPYEPTALKRLAGRHDTRIDELDRLLRAGVFVDLYRVVRQGLRASVESYSIKKMEPFYAYGRQIDLRQASGALASFEAWLQLGGTRETGEALLGPIEGYNRDDCLSTLALRSWLETLRAQLVSEGGEDVPRPSAESQEASAELTERLREARALVARLTAGVRELREQRSPEQEARWLLAQMLEYHRRESKSTWWRYYNWLGMSDEELVEDGSVIGDLEYVRVVGEQKRSDIHRYRFPPQEHALKPGTETRDPVTRSGAGQIVALNEAAGTLDLKREKGSDTPHPRALIPFEYVNDEVMQASLLRIGHAVADHGLVRTVPCPSAVDLLLATSPRTGQAPGTSLIHPDELSLDAAIRLVAELDHSILPIQGPPGAGKTYTGARMIVAELARGRRVGVTATSHKVISHLLREVCEAAGDSGLYFQGIQKGTQEQWCEAGAILPTTHNARVREALETGEAQLAAGTAWLWSRADMRAAVDVLFIDEAGQFSLANALAVAPAASSLVLLGDPQQLQQPQQGLHPPGAEVSALDHLLQGHATVPSDRGLFLEQTWRLHPAICAFTSELYYEDRLRSRPGLERQRVSGNAPVTGNGLRWLPVEHEGNQNDSPEEAAEVAALVGALLGAGLTVSTSEFPFKRLALEDILVVSPYNAQVAALEKVLPEGARVGTVDRFQGQEAPIVLYSMASSTAEEAPRGMEFLYDPHRMNVATSRAQCLVIVVANQRLLFPECRTPAQMRMANGLCRYLELIGT
jgi:predicted RecB family nuclease